MLTGGGGHDTFVVDRRIMQNGYVPAAVEITDFDPTNDVIDVSDYLLFAHPGGGDPFSNGTLALQASTNGGTALVDEKSSAAIVLFDNIAPGSFTSADFITGAASPSPAPSPSAAPVPSPSPSSGNPTPTPNESRDYIAPGSSGIATGTLAPDDVYATADNQTLVGGGGDDIFHIGTHTGLTLLESGPGISAVSTYLSSYVLPTGINNLSAADGNSHSFTGNSGDNVITGSTGNDTLAGGAGNDLLIGSGGTDTYLFGSGDGQDTIDNGTGLQGGGGIDTSLQAGALDFGTGIATNQLWFAQSGNDLKIDRMGSTDSVTIAGWYADQGSKFTFALLETIKTSDGQMLDAGLNNLVQAMATFQANNPGFDPTATAQAPSDPTLQAAIAANWHG